MESGSQNHHVSTLELGNLLRHSILISFFFFNNISVLIMIKFLIFNCFKHYFFRETVIFPSESFLFFFFKPGQGSHKELIVRRGLRLHINPDAQIVNFYIVRSIQVNPFSQPF